MTKNLKGCYFKKTKITTAKFTQSTLQIKTLNKIDIMMTNLIMHILYATVQRIN